LNNDESGKKHSHVSVDESPQQNEHLPGQCLQLIVIDCEVEGVVALLDFWLVKRVLEDAEKLVRIIGQQA